MSDFKTKCFKKTEMKNHYQLLKNEAPTQVQKPAVPSVSTWGWLQNWVSPPQTPVLNCWTTIEKQLPYRGTPLKRTALIRGAIWDSPPAVLKLRKQLGWRQNIYINQTKTTITWMTEILNRPTLRRFYWSLLKMIKGHRKMKPLTRACKLVCLV